MDSLRQRLLTTLRKDCLLHGKFKLHGGGESDTYLDCRRLWRSSSVGMVSAVLVEKAEEMSRPFDTVGTVGIGGLSLLSAFLLRWRQATIGQDSVDGFCVRDKTKDHGVTSIGGQVGGISQEIKVDGWLNPGAHVLLLDDVLTTGSSLRNIEKVVLDKGGAVVGALVLVDRRVEPCDPMPWPVKSVFTLDEVVGR